MNVTTTSSNINDSPDLSSSSETEWELMPEPDISEVVIEDEQPVDNLISEKQQRLLTSSAYSSLNVEIPFLVTANVGLFYAEKKPPLVPDVMLSFRVKCPEDWSQKKNRSYFIWNFGKSPEIAIEIVSNKGDNELESKLEGYLDAVVSYYVIFDPLKYLSENVLQVYKRQVVRYQLQENYLLEELNLGLTLWSGEFEGQFYEQWLRWCDGSGNILLTGDEKFELEKQRADRLAQILREQGIDPDTI
ncbi:Uma2 family endonuclease [Crocosphaera sp. XPORK-15E]|uniref:Uma2 family endonuclease n=1 Tax=Crocosphaera sp. XPORK-15E TaxID=3110247 RepID=UPI002B20FBC4|nr:Uma2 family endonuclease [Crocosphaera sp. XPORK-15E]MEA5533897.1 Uma2 family endonuclease [Crocosphaera sp. XPORK-15E]